MKQLIIVIMILISNISWAQTARERLYNRFVADDISSWRGIIDSLQQYRTQNNNLLTVIDAQYGYIAWSLAENKRSEAEKQIPQMESNLKELLSKYDYSAEYHAYNGALLSFKLGLAKWKAPILGPKILEETDKALRLSPYNPLALNLKANGLYYRPSILGGDKIEALRIYLQCEKIMEEINTKDWKYITLLITIAQLYESSGNTRAAIEYCNKILKSEPNFKWVKETYLPQLLSEKTDQ